MATVAHKNLTGTDLHEPKGVAAASANQIYIADGVGSGAWSAIPDVAITTKTGLTAPAVDDELVIYDLSATTNKKITLTDLLEVLNALTEDTSPAPSTDYLLSYDASASTVKKVKIENVAPDPDTALIEVSGSWTPAMAFGGGTTGLTYTTQVGRYTKIGSLVHAWGSIVINDNGSSTGSATVTGLPFTSSTVAGLVCPVAVVFDDNADIEGMYASLASNSTVIDLWDVSASSIGLVAATQANFPNASQVHVTAVYRTG